MSDEIISALISSFGAVVCCLIGIKIGKENSLKGMSKEVLQQQLDMVYSPIIRSWYQNPDQEVSDRLAFIQKIFFENFDLIMPSLYQQMMHLQSSEGISENAFADFKRAIESNYNWNKKLLGYPYKKSAIFSIDLPTHGKYQGFIDVICAIAPSIGLVSLIFTTSPLYNQIFFANIKDSSYPYFFVISLFFLMYLATKLMEIFRSKKKTKKKNNSSQK